MNSLVYKENNTSLLDMRGSDKENGGQKLSSQILFQRLSIKDLKESQKTDTGSTQQQYNDRFEDSQRS
jgi:hypothetical protein